MRACRADVATIIKSGEGQPTSQFEEPMKASLVQPPPPKPVLSLELDHQEALYLLRILKGDTSIVEDQRQEFLQMVSHLVHRMGDTK